MRPVVVCTHVDQIRAVVPRTPHGCEECLALGMPWVHLRDVRPLPPHITIEQAASMARALLKGDPDAAGVVRQSMRELAAGVSAHVP